MANHADNGPVAMYPCEQFDIVGAVVTFGGRARQARTLASGRAAEIARRRIAAPWLSQLTTNVLLPLIIVVTTAIAAVKHGPTRVYWSLGTFVAVFVIGLISYNKDRTSAAVRDKAIQSRTELATALNDTAQPLVVALGNVTAADSVDEAKENVAVLIDRAVSLAQTELARSSDSRTRSALYCIEGDRLVRKVYHGWNGADAPRREFVRGRSEHDDEVIRFVHGENALLVEDLENHPPPHFADFRGRSYKSFVSVPVRGGNKSFGLLTADSDEPYALTEIERGFLIVIAGALAAGMAHVDTLESKDRNYELGPQIHKADGGGQAK